MPEVDWAEWYSGDCCPARMGEPCFLLSSGGPEALPPIHATRPHATRRRKPPPGAEPPERPAAPAKPRTQPQRTAVARRSASRTQSTAAAWQKLAARQRGNRS